MYRGKLTFQRRPPDGTFEIRLWRIAVPLLIAVLEFGSISLFVELPDIGMSQLGMSSIFSGSLLSLVIFLWVAPRRTGLRGPQRASRAVEATFWLCAHLVLFQAFLAMTLRLSEMTGPATVSTGTSAWWLVLALLLAFSVFLPFVSPVVLARWVGRSAWQAALALTLGLALIGLTGPVRRLWPEVCWPAASVAQALVIGLTGDTTSVGVRGEFPVIGVDRLRLIVTPQCSELESILAFGLLGLALLIAKRKDVRIGRLALMGLLGAAFLYLLNAARLSVLVLLGLRFSSELCVNVAHSRIGGILFLAVSIAWWAVACRIGRLPKTARNDDAAN